MTILTIFNEFSRKFGTFPLYFGCLLSRWNFLFSFFFGTFSSKKFNFFNYLMKVLPRRKSTINYKDKKDLFKLWHWDWACWTSYCCLLLDTFCSWHPDNFFANFLQIFLHFYYVVVAVVAVAIAVAVGHLQFFIYFLLAKTFSSNFSRAPALRA